MIYRFGQCQLNTQLVELQRDGQAVAVEPQVFRLLQLLLEKHQQVLSKDDILAAIWQNRVVSDASLSSCIKAARQAIGDSGEEQLLIRTIRGHGFRFVAEVTVQDAGAAGQAAITNVSAPSGLAAEPKPLPINSSLPQFKAPASPLAGREREVQRLTNCLQNTLNQQAQLLLIAGTAGIGKSRLLEEATLLAGQQGMLVMWGRCREEAGAPAYWPWRQLLVSHFRAQQWLDASSAPELARLLPELFTDPAAAMVDSQQSPDQTRFKLFHAIASLLMYAVNSQPLMLIFDDLHRADDASLRLLEFIASQLSHSPVMIMGTYRDTDLNEGHRFYQTLSEFSRLSHYHTLQLGHLQAAAARDYVLHSLPELNSDIIDSILLRTDGHPLYLHETVRHLQQGGNPDSLPLSLKAIISQRFAHLPEESVLVLRAASVIGRRFELATLANILGYPAHKVLACLDPALQSGQILALDVPGDYGFSHTLLREALYDALLVSDRLHYHCNLAEYLEQQQGDLAQIAFHYHQAAPLGMAKKACSYAIRAAEEAKQVMAFEIAARFYQQALQTALPQDKAQLYLDLGMTQVRAGATLQAIDNFDEAAKLAEQSQQLELFAHAAIGMEEAIWRPGILSNRALVLLQRALQKLDSSHAACRFSVICTLMRANMICGFEPQARDFLGEARRYASERNEPEVTARLLLAELFTTQLSAKSAELLAQRLPKAKMAAQLAEQANNQELYLEIMSWHMQDLFIAGLTDELDAILLHHQQVGIASKQPFFNYFTALWRVLFATARGQFTKALGYAAQALELCSWLPGLDGDGVYGIQVFSIKREQGALAGLAPVVEHFVNSTPEQGIWKPGMVLTYCELGLYDKARPLFYQLMRDELQHIPKDAMWVTCVAYLTEVCVKLGERQYASLLYQQLQSYQGLNILIGSNIGTLGCADRYLGMLAALQQQWQVAEQHLQFALNKNQQLGFTVHAAHCRFDYALMLSQRQAPGDMELALSLLDETLAECQQCAMQGLAEQALNLRQRLRSGPATHEESDGLSRRELEVLALMAAGKQNKEIADKLFISSNTVAAHIRNILEKTATTNRTEAVHYAVSRGLLSDKAQNSQGK